MVKIIGLHLEVIFKTAFFICVFNKTYSVGRIGLGLYFIACRIGLGRIGLGRIGLGLYFIACL